MANYIVFQRVPSSHMASESAPWFTQMISTSSTLRSGFSNCQDWLLNGNAKPQQIRSSKTIREDSIINHPQQTSTAARAEQPRHLYRFYKDTTLTSVRSCTQYTLEFQTVCFHLQSKCDESVHLRLTHWNCSATARGAGSSNHESSWALSLESRNFLVERLQNES